MNASKPTSAKSRVEPDLDLELPVSDRPLPLSRPLDPEESALFLKDSPALFGIDRAQRDVARGYAPFEIKD